MDVAVAEDVEFWFALGAVRPPRLSERPSSGWVTLPRCRIPISLLPQP